MNINENPIHLEEVAYLIDGGQVYIPPLKLRQDILQYAEPLSTIFEKSLVEMGIDGDVEAQIDILRGDANMAEPGDAIWKLGTARWVTRLGVSPLDPYWYQQMVQAYKQGDWMQTVINNLPSFKEAVDNYKNLLNQPVGTRSYSEALEAWFGMMFFKGVSTEKIENIILSIYASTPDVQLIPIRGDIKDAHLIYPGSTKTKPIKINGGFVSKLVDEKGQVLLEGVDKEENKAERRLNTLIQQEVKRRLVVLGREI